VIPGRPLRVLWLTKGLGRGGAERLLVEQAAAADRERFTFEAAYLLPTKSHLVGDLEELGVRTHCLGVTSDADPRWLVRLARLVHRGRFDVVHAHSPLSASAARVLVRVGFPSVRFVYTEHNRWPSYHPVTRTLDRATFGLNHAAIAVSKDVVDSMVPRARARTAAVTHGVDLEAMRANLRSRDDVRRELGVGPHELLAVTVANYREHKRYPDLLAAARTVVDAGAPVRFAAAGHGPLEAEVRAEHRRLALGDRFVLLGFREDAPRLIAGADLFVLASSHEGLPVTLMEAFALGVPAVVTSAGGIVEAVSDGVEGLLVEPGDPAALADAIIRATDPALRARLAVGAERAAERFSSSVAARQIEAVYERVVR
jgi:glycosyltransferase involved in cell wall biosynthesis